MTSRELAREIIKVASDMKATGPVVLDLRTLVDFTDYFIVMSGTSDRQVRAIADKITERLEALKCRPLGVEGHETAHWILIDCGDVVVHIFYSETRAFYALEKLWSDAPRVRFRICPPTATGPVISRRRRVARGSTLRDRLRRQIAARRVPEATGPVAAHATYRPFALIILDGWGMRESAENNAVRMAHLPNFNSFIASYPVTSLEASGEAVGLMPGVMGNSEVGHINLGAGRVVWQTLTEVSRAIEDGSFFKNKALKLATRAARDRGSALHIMGLLSDAGVHSHIEHLFAILKLARMEGISDVYIHPFMDGRDSSPTSGAGFLSRLQEKLDELGTGKIATLSGRYFAMDRDRRWERIERSWQALFLGKGERTAVLPAWVMKKWYEEVGPRPGFGDEFLPPTVILDPATKSEVATIKEGDAVIFFNFRPDRARELARAMTDPDFSGFGRPTFSKLSAFVCMAPYGDDLSLPYAFPRKGLVNILPEILAKKGLTQYRLAETEKYAHVTYFFNGGDERVFAGEDRKLVPSDRGVETYDLAPEMQATRIKKEFLRDLKESPHDLYVVNFANPDMVGHTGKKEAIVRALETVDECLGEMVREVLGRGGGVIITADHGNCEEIVDENGGPHTQHTTNVVPFILIAEGMEKTRLRPGSLCDVAPTILELLGIKQPKEMTGESLLCHRLTL